MLNNSHLHTKILRALNQRSKPIPIGTLAMAVGVDTLVVSGAVQDLILGGLVRVAKPGEVESGVEAYLPVKPSAADAYESLSVPEPAIARKTASWSKTIGLDFDGVLGDFVTPCMAVMTAVTGRVYRPEDNREWDLFGQLSEEERKEVFRVIEAPGWCDNILPYPGAVEGVRMLQDAGHTLLCVTAPWTSPTWEYERKACLKRHFGDAIPMISTHAKEYVACDVLVEDKVANLEKWVDRQKGRGFLWAQPYNQSYPTKKMIRVSSWQEVLELC